MHVGKRITTQNFLLIIPIATFYLSLIGSERPLIPLNPQQPVSSLFNPGKVLKKGLPLHQYFNSNITIAPNEKSIIISHSGKIYQKHITTYFNRQPETKLLFKHPSVNLSTMIALDETEDGSLLIASGGNYYNNERDKWTSEIISYKNGSYELKEFDWPLQALKMSNKGTLLVAATLSSIILFNLKKMTEAAVGFEHFHGCYTNREGHRIIDLDIADATFVLAVGKFGVMQLMNINDEQTGLSLAKRCQIKDNIAQLTLVTARSILCATKRNEAKIIDMFNFLEYTNKPEDTDKPIAKDFSHSRTYDQVTLDRLSQTTAHWTKNENLTEEERSTILIYRITNPKNPVRWESEEERIEPHKEHYKLCAHFCKNNYDFISNEGKLEEHNSHFLTVSLCKSTIVALASTGEIFVWKLPVVQSYNKNKDTEEETSFKPLRRSRTESEKDEYVEQYVELTPPKTTITPSGRQHKRTTVPSFMSPRSHRSTSISPSSTPPKLSPKEQKEQKDNLRSSDSRNSSPSSLHRYKNKNIPLHSDEDKK